MKMDAVVVAQVLIVSVIAAISYWWYKLKRLERKLDWIPHAPGVPILGNALELRNSTDTLTVMLRYVEEYAGLCVLDVGTRKIVLVTDVRFLEFLLTTTKILDKAEEYEYLGRWLGQGLLTAKGPRWKKSRKIITPTFHFNILEQFVPVFDTNSNILVGKLEREVGKEIDIYPFVTMCSLDIICETAMGVSINAQTNPQSDYVFAVKEMCRITVDRSFSALKRVNFFYRFFRDYYKELRYVKTLHSHTTSVINSRRQELKNIETNKKGEEEDEQLGVKKKMAFLDLLLQANMDGKPLPDEMIREEVDTFMFEGHDTTASAITFILYCLVDHPVIQARVVEEQIQIFRTDRHRATTYRDLQEMKYLELVIKESLRLYPSVPFFARETDRDTEYKDGQILPKGINLMIFSYGVNRDPVVFPEPDRFDPSRFENMTRTSPFSYIPFSAGPRNCIGQKFAMLEIKAVVSKLLRFYELFPTNPKHTVILAAESVLKSTNGVRLRLRKRYWDVGTNWLTSELVTSEI